jgi:diaminohydroxyphosphoribosylaminopyrimidine deaminase/5-amino-6-(5-phosphoribosylamino)uracil reductase
MDADEKFMRAALTEARKGIGKTTPNPAVGAVIVKNNRILSRGWHRAAGKPHAEIEALKALGGRTARGATLYVTLEPCSTTGRTPPCTAAIVEAEFSRVVYGATDPNPRHAGRAEKILRAARIAVTAGVLQKDCADLNTAWNKWISTGLPYVIAKAGITLDGRINSPPGRRWITGEASRRDAMKLRASVQAVLVGGETVRTDDPSLTVRGPRISQQPWRAVWTKTGRLPPGSRLLCDEFRERTMLFRNVSLRTALRSLARRGVVSVLIEGGSQTFGEAFDRGLVDEVSFYMAPIFTGGPKSVVGGRGVATSHNGVTLSQVTYTKIGADVRMTGFVVQRKE